MTTRSDAFSVRVIFAGVVIVLLAMGVRATFGLFMLTMGPATGTGRDVFFHGVCPTEPYLGGGLYRHGHSGRSLRSGLNDRLGRFALYVGPDRDAFCDGSAWLVSDGGTADGHRAGRDDVFGAIARRRPFGTGVLARHGHEHRQRGRLLGAVCGGSRRTAVN